MGSILPSNLENLRKERGLSQARASDRDNLGVTEKTLRSWENGSTLPDGYNIIKLCDFYGVSADYILGRAEQRHIGNKEISDSLGLSEESVEALRFLHNDSEQAHSIIVDFINLVLEDAWKRIVEYKKDPEINAPIDTVFSSLARYVSPSESELSYLENGNRIVISGPCAYITSGDDSCLYTIAELAKTTLLERIKRQLEHLAEVKRNGVDED